MSKGSDMKFVIAAAFLVVGATVKDIYFNKNNNKTQPTGILQYGAAPSKKAKKIDVCATLMRSFCAILFFSNKISVILYPRPFHGDFTILRINHTYFTPNNRV